MIFREILNLKLIQFIRFFINKKIFVLSNAPSEKSSIRFFQNYEMRIIRKTKNQDNKIKKYLSLFSHLEIIQLKL